MHESSILRMKSFVDKYVDLYAGKKVLDVGSYDVNGTYSRIFEGKNIVYTGMDISSGPNVDIVVNDIYNWKEIEDEEYDYIISGQALEHMEYPWLAMEQIYKKLKNDGIACIIAPNGFWEHRYPIDCYRYFKDGLIALAKWANFEIIETYVAGVPSKYSSRSWDEFCNDAMIVVCKSKKIKETFSDSPLFQCERLYEPILDINENYKFLCNWCTNKKNEEYLFEYLEKNKIKEVIMIGDGIISDLISPLLEKKRIEYKTIHSILRKYDKRSVWKENREDLKFEVNNNTLILLTLLDSNRIVIKNINVGDESKVKYIDDVLVMGYLYSVGFFENKCYLYGTGKNSEIIYKTLIGLNIEIQGFIVSDDRYNNSFFNNTKVYKMSEIERNASILVTPNDNSEILYNLKKNCFTNFFVVKDIINKY